MRKTLNEVLQCILFMISRVLFFFCFSMFFSVLLFLYCALRAHVRLSVL